ncbi:MAG: signal peptidase I [Planctomycetota bacterium]|nr:MAG: signal peptidase I [Planctomycetota bacterium]
MKRRPLFLLALLALAAVGLLFQPVRVSGPSMAPTLLDGEVRLTRPLWLGAPERDDLVVFREPDTEQVAVKRVAGLPGERIRLAGGDLFIDGRRRRREVSGLADLVPLVDAAPAAIPEEFHLPPEDEEPAARPPADGFLHAAGRAFLRAVPLDGWLGPDGLVLGSRPAADLGVAADFELLAPDSRLELLLVEGSSTFALAAGGGACVLSRDGAELARAPLPPGFRRGRLFLAKVDRRLTARLDGRELFPPVSYTPATAVPLADGLEGPPFEQAGFGGRQVLLRRIGVGRDIFREATGTWACSRELQLKEDEYFLLGDHPDASRDSRHYGPVSRERLLGVVGPRLWGGTGG